CKSAINVSNGGVKEFKEMNEEKKKFKEDKGPCFAYFPRYYYNTTTNACEQFIYGGCRGNANNFETLERCESKCGDVSLTEELIRSKLITRTGYSVELQINANAEIHTDFVRCHDHRTAVGRGHLVRFGLGRSRSRERAAGKVRNGRSGCNRPDIYIIAVASEDVIRANPILSSEVVSLEDAIRANPILSREVVGVNPVCNETKYPGPCAGYFPRYYFNNVTKTCEQFIYGGCQANGNNFQTLGECQNTCWASLDQHSLKIIGAVEVPFWPFTPPEVCTYAADAGPCEAYMSRFFYNTLTKTCEQFVYGGMRRQRQQLPHLRCVREEMQEGLWRRSPRLRNKGQLPNENTLRWMKFPIANRKHSMG
ncbi:hypothetical protein MTO96_044635, partial [Rhipicephalus appendiculatus]